MIFNYRVGVEDRGRDGLLSSMEEGCREGSPSLGGGRHRIILISAALRSLQSSACPLPQSYLTKTNWGGSVPDLQRKDRGSEKRSKFPYLFIH
jgi:hypothetical protein